MQSRLLNRLFLRIHYLCVGSVIAAAILTQPAGASADPTTARIAAGGIEFLKNNDIRMLEEVLEISRKAIRVRFSFLNDSSKDIHTTIAFPLPPRDMVSRNERPGAQELLERTFKVQVDGQPVSTTTSRKAMIGDRDITASLRRIGLSDKQIFDDGYVPAGDLTAIQKSALGKLGREMGQLAEWGVATSMVWEQIFPAKKETVVEHEYIPVRGGAYRLIHNGEPGFSIFDLISQTSGSDACLDETARREIETRIKACAAKSDKMDHVTADDVEYILSTGRNWKGPIGAFTLRIVKDLPDQIVSLCFPGKPKNISPTVYEFHQRDYMPQDRLVVYFYTVGPDIHN